MKNKERIQRFNIEVSVLKRSEQFFCELYKKDCMWEICSVTHDHLNCDYIRAK